MSSASDVLRGYGRRKCCQVSYNLSFPSWTGTNLFYELFISLQITSVCSWRAAQTSTVPVFELLWCLTRIPTWMALFLVFMLSLTHTFPAEMMGVRRGPRNEGWLVPVLAGGENLLCCGKVRRFLQMFISPVDLLLSHPVSVGSGEPGIFGLNVRTAGQKAAESFGPSKCIQLRRKWLIVSTCHKPQLLPPLLMISNNRQKTPVYKTPVYTHHH